MELKDCLRKKRIKRINPNNDISRSYLEQAERTLSKIKDSIIEKDYLWASVKTYYAAYYALSAFLWKMGVISDNHDCSIKLVAFILDDELLMEYLNTLKKSRIDNQYYLKISDENTLLNNYELAKRIYIEFYNLCNSDNKSIEHYVKKASKFF
jgi:uncharacterized protein (UPF0332 family)